MQRRKRKCEDCEKPLGGTIVKCFECGGEKPSPSKKERLSDGKEWAALLGVERSVVKSVHEKVLGTDKGDQP